MLQWYMQQLGPFACSLVPSSCTQIMPAQSSGRLDHQRQLMQVQADMTYVSALLYSFYLYRDIRPSAPHWLFNGLGLEEKSQRFVHQSAAALQATASSLMPDWHPVRMACCTAALCM